MQRGALVRRGLVAGTLGVAAIALLSSGCHRSKQYQANVEVTRVNAIRKDDAGKVLTMDFEMSYFECPGSQIEVVRGDASFAACVSKFKVGDKLKVDIDHKWSDEGHYTSVVKKIGDCDRIEDPNDEASYAMIRECDDWPVNGTKVGFRCKYVPKKGLIDKCPWFQKR